MAAPGLQLRVPEDTLARIDHVRGEDTRSAWLLRLIDRELAGQHGGEGVISTSSAPAAASPGTLGPGESSPGVACSAPGCWNRNTARYGLRRIPLCRACAAALTGKTYLRFAAPAQARAIKGTAA